MALCNGSLCGSQCRTRQVWTWNRNRELVYSWWRIPAVEKTTQLVSLVALYSWWWKDNFVASELFSLASTVFYWRHFSSTVIQDILGFNDSQPCPENTSVAFYYCSFTDSKKQKVINIIYSFLLQLFQRLLRVPSSLTDLYNQHKYRQPQMCDLKMTLRSVICESEQSFLIIDALDECIDENETRREILTFLTDFSNWNLSQLHILVTSRKELEIEKSLTSLENLNPICIQTHQQNM